MAKAELARDDSDLAPLLAEMQRLVFTYFLYPAFAHLNGGAVLKPTWAVEALGYELELVRRGKSRRLIINMPPRNLKSTVVSVAWVAFMLGIDPTLNFVCVSYSQDLASQFARECFAIMDSPWYRALFPRTILARRAALDFTTTAGGGRLATSIDGTLTGRGGDIIIIDDPSKPDDLHSEAMRLKVETWYRSTLISRLNDKATGAIIVVMQRIHMFDLTGLLLEQDDDWRHLSLSAIATKREEFPLLLGGTHVRNTGDVLSPAVESAEDLARTQRIAGSYYWSAQYQQQPVPEEGNFAMRSWFTYFDPTSPPYASGTVVQSWDTASKEGIHNDYSVCVTAVVADERVHIINVYRAKLTIPKLLAQIEIQASIFRPTTLLIEDAASGREVIEILRQKTPPGVPRPIACQPEHDKKTRFAAQSSRIQSGQVLFANDKAWVETFVDELVAFPAGHDDQVDALSQLLIWFGKQAFRDTVGPPPEIPPPHDIPGGDDLDDDWYDEDEEDY